MTVQKLTDNWRRRELIQLLLVQILIVPVVVLIFRYISPPKVAALYAGSLFTAFGLLAMYKVFKHASPGRNWLFWLVVIHVFVISIPMMAVRLANWGAEFTSLTIWGLPAPLFHSLSSAIYLGIMAFIGLNIYLNRKV